MLRKALNHMTVARQSFAELLATAGSLGCEGIELRNDLPPPLFDGLSPAQAGERISAAGLRLLALAEVKMFNDWSDAKASEAASLIAIAKAAGAEAVSLIPRNDGLGLNNGERQASLRLALREIKPMLDEAGLVGLVEPLGFEVCSLRHKSEAVDAIDAVGGNAVFRLVHDTFHHHLAGGGPIFPEMTGMVHISGVVDASLEAADMGDEHRVLVDANDRLGNLAQLRALAQAGYNGPISFEAFAAEVHQLPDLNDQIGRSFEFIRSSLAKEAALDGCDD